MRSKMKPFSQYSVAKIEWHIPSVMFFNESIKAHPTTVLPGTTATVLEDPLVRTI